jgi:hypothetical protein
MSNNYQEIMVPEGDDPAPFKVQRKIINRYTEKSDWEEIGSYKSEADAIQFAQSRQDRQCRVLHRRKTIWPTK